MNARDLAALREIIRLCDVAANLTARGHDWYTGDPDNVPGLAGESLIIKVGENVARLSAETIAHHPDVPWADIKRMRDRLAHRYDATDYAVVWTTLSADLPTIRSYLKSATS
ncbi:HepT-like ribonuclease domain-containing protein [Solicola gregarius]|uniref:DUF86 domain-containing protein n=1 Tax=Solicola gregarius TaxID=2908642 RepID=A0AA46YME8_9ACTN|nr:HepT-like ribonuclease domain-containing protein [Solicola gregarius]UYM07677.1 DUF86 domain-containing protein [Solicola gregarius]